MFVLLKVRRSKHKEVVFFFYYFAFTLKKTLLEAHKLTASLEQNGKLSQDNNNGKSHIKDVIK